METTIEQKIIPSIEKLIKLTKEIQQDMTELSKRVEALEKNNSNNLSDQIAALTMQVNSLEANNMELRTQNEINSYHANADEELYNYMFAAKDEEANDMPMSKKEIRAAMANYMSRATGLPIEPDESDEE